MPRNHDREVRALLQGGAEEAGGAMTRRMLGVALLLGVLVSPLAAEAQQGRKVYRVGLIFSTSPISEMAGPEPVHPSARAFVQGLRALGYVEGQNLLLERRSAEGRFERFGDIVADLVRLKADVIVTVGDPMPRAALTTSVAPPSSWTRSSRARSQRTCPSNSPPSSSWSSISRRPRSSA